jgi:hypothetical protein
VILVAREGLVEGRGDLRAFRDGDQVSCRLRSFSGDGNDLGPVGFGLRGGVGVFLTEVAFLTGVAFMGWFVAVVFG